MVFEGNFFRFTGSVCFQKNDIGGDKRDIGAAKEKGIFSPVQ